MQAASAVACAPARMRQLPAGGQEAAPPLLRVPLRLHPRRPRAPAAAAASNNDPSSSSGLDPEIEALLRKYDSASPKPSIPPRAKQQQQQPKPPPQIKAAARARPSSSSSSSSSPTVAAATTPTGNGTFLLCFACLAVFVADNLLHLPGVARAFHMVHSQGHLLSPWWTTLTHSFAHANWQHLSANLFPLLVFGKLVEETEGAFGVVVSYLLTAAGAALASVFLTPGGPIVSVGASGAVFGLFSIAVLTRFSPDPRRLLEFVVFGQFVVQQVLSEVKAQAAGGLALGSGGLAVSHVAHLAGALAGVLLILLLRAIPDVPAGGDDG
jgi:membrane associated rhomboid family serine protease